jgi:L-glyceraldehyde 3-phosphate reductase
VKSGAKRGAARGFRDDRYESAPKGWFRRCGKSGLNLPAVSLGCWHNFGGAGTDAGHHTAENAMHVNARAMLRTAFDHGITHFDLANNYGPPPGSAEERVGRILADDFRAHRRELVISTKAGYGMWAGPYGDFGSRKYLLSSLDESLKRLRLNYVDIFYHHRPDDATPVEESMSALDTAIRQGKAIYGGISNYNGVQTQAAVDACAANGFYRPVIHQPYYNMLGRWIEDDLLPVVHRTGLGTIAFCPLAQGQLTAKYLKGIPKDSRARSTGGFLKEKDIKEETLRKVRTLDAIAQRRGQTLAQMVLAWTVRPAGVTSALIGASRPEQIVENVAALKQHDFSSSELDAIDAALKA